MANFNLYEFPQAFPYSQYGDALFPCYSGNSAQIPFHQNTQPSQAASSFRQPEQPRTQTPVPQEASLGETSSSSSKKSAAQRERWNFNDERVLLQLWADNIDKIESKDSRKAWEDITRALNEIINRLILYITYVAYVRHL